MINKAVLWVTAVVFIGYGLVCIIAPQIPAAYSGLILNNADSWIETAAMYGGLQTGLGVFCLIAALKPEYNKAGLLMIMCLIGGLAAVRAVSFAITTDPVTSYTFGALGYEALTAILAAIAFFKPTSESTKSQQLF
ncbi:MAG: DUF4345 family protein [Pseudomonadales bacterium]|nr:DUF4345 family protein [Pseudomonadales bacterium]